jgi:hypothetical protein
LNGRTISLILADGVQEIRDEDRNQSARISESTHLAPWILLLDMLHGNFLLAEVLMKIEKFISGLEKEKEMKS